MRLGRERPRPNRQQFGSSGGNILAWLNVLVVEESDAVMELVIERLVQTFGGCSRLECTSKPSIACESLADTKFDAILLDASLANHRNHSGKTALASIRSGAPDTPLFLLLDRNHQLQETESLTGGADGCLFKNELREQTWLRRLYGVVIHRRTAALIPWNN